MIIYHGANISHNSRECNQRKLTTEPTYPIILKCKHRHVNIGNLKCDSSML